MMNSGLLAVVSLTISLCLFSILPLQAALKVEADETQRSFTVRTDRLEAKFQDGQIVNLRNLLTGETLADESLSETVFPSGLGHLSGDVASMSAIHHPWGGLKILQKGRASTPNYRRPHDGSTFSCKITQTGAVAEWLGLHNGTDSYPEDRLRIEVAEDAAGSLFFKAAAISAEKGVFGVTVPLVNISAEAEFYIPSFGGMKLKGTGNPSLHTYGGAPFFEAPVMAAEIGGGSFALWKEDGEFHPWFTFINWTGNSYGCAFEHLNLMPFEQHLKTESPGWKLDVTAGTWMSAMTPYKQWYAKYFATEITVRDNVEWADKINVIIDISRPNRKTCEAIASHFPAETVLIHQWTARAEGFSANLPDYEPSKGYVENVKLRQEFGFKSMAYVNTYCAVYNSPVWIRDNVGEKFLTRKYSLSSYGKASTDRVMDNLTGDVQGAAAAADQFAGMKDGRFLYGDPLQPEWRKYHAEQMALWNSTTGTDANYEDTAGCVGDFGNGVVDGKFAAQGSVEAMRELLKRQPGVPMASEYGPEPIAFAVKWPLAYAQVWGGHAFRNSRKHRQAPVCAYLYDYRIWIPLANAGTDFLKHVVTACSDATGGLGMSPGSKEALECQSGFVGHMVWRSKIFAGNGLKPYFDPGVREMNLVSMYQDRAGGLYRYYDDGFLQRMVGPDGRELYGRVDKTSRLETGLRIPGWPAVNGNVIFGLAPDQRYALFPAVAGEEPPVQIDALPEGVVVRQSRWDANYALLVLDSADKDPATAKITLPLTLNCSFKTLCTNGKTEELVAGTANVSVETLLPAHILLAGDAPAPGFNTMFETEFEQLKIRKVSRATGLQETVQTEDIANLKRYLKAPGSDKRHTAIVLWGAGWENTIDFLVTVPDGNAAVSLLTKNASAQYGDASIAKLYINGELKKSLDAIRENPNWEKGMPSDRKNIRDCDTHAWVVPLPEYRGKTILVTIASDPKNDGNADQQHLSIPEFIPY